MTLSFSSAGATVVSIASDEVRVQGMREGDLIVMAGGRPVRTEADLSAAIATARAHRAVVLLGVRHRDGSAVFISIPTSN